MSTSPPVEQAPIRNAGSARRSEALLALTVEDADDYQPRKRMTNKPMCAVLAHQRSGSNYFRSLLWSNPSISSYGEVLFPNFDKNGFFHYYQQRLQEDWNKLLLSDPVIANEIFSDFFRYSAEKKPKAMVAYDIKLDQLYAFPVLYNTFDNLNFKIALLRRRNVLARVVSHYVMLKRFESGDFNIHYSEPKLVQVAVDPQHAVKMINDGLQFEEYIVGKYSGQEGRFFEVYYEDLAAEEKRCRTLVKFAQFMGARRFPDDAKFSPIKQSLWPLEEIVTNWSELTDSLQASGLGWALEHTAS